MALQNFVFVNVCGFKLTSDYLTMIETYAI